MTTTTEATKHQLKAGEISFTFLNSGDLFEANHGWVMINQLLGNPVDGSLNNLYLRLHRKEGMKVVPLLGVKSPSTFYVSEKAMTWKGTVEDVNYVVTFHLTNEGVWFWDVKVDGADVEIDVIYGQDISIASKGAVRNNEAYVAQYIDHAIFESTNKGYVVCSRQNQPQPGGFPYLQQGSLTKATGYLTDGFQFFGLSYKETDVPEVLYKDSLPNEVYQFEFAYTALQSEKVKLAGEAQFVFYGLFKENHEEAITDLAFEDEVQSAWESIQGTEVEIGIEQRKVSDSNKIGAPVQTATLTMDEVNKYFPIRRQEEWEGDTLLSFFTETHEHVVLKEKELIVERPHGHIIMTGQNDKMKENVFSSTSYMYGIFNSQVVVGNTSFNKMLSNARNALNVYKTSGQRIFVEVEGTYQLLTMPSMYEIGFNYARWYYKTATDMIIITNYTMVDTPELQLHVQSESGKQYRYLVTNQVVVSANELETPFLMKEEDGVVTFTAHESSMSANVYPELTYKFRVDGTNMKISNEGALVENADPNSASLVVLELDSTSDWTMTIQGLLHGEEVPFTEKNAVTEIARYRDFLRECMNGFELSLHGGETEELEKVNSVAWWYTHNMLVHFTVPHGLEQYSGAAWGTRDVCQGPTEYFMATQKYESVKEILKTVYSHQFEDDGNWPQWFMFDRYNKIQAGESHGDIIVWPLKVLADYLSVTKDFSILEEQVPYTIRGQFDLTEETATIFDHAKKQIDYMKNNFVHDTHLSSYGDGDWDDTLQPANAQLRDFMVSSWTVSLTYQVMKKFANVLAEVNKEEASELMTLAEGIEADFNKYMLKTDVIPGFVYMEEPGKVEYMVHPEDTKTGINYRLLPMTRSMISELLTPEQAASHYDLIKKELYCPDGVRLMNRPAKYEGGVSKHFKRAEQASNFGREIGLQYVHAHIRFVEAMAKLGKEDEAWKGLAMINPIGIQNVVPNAERRQSNTYFSSSDGKFSTRYEAQEQFGKLRDGSVQVKGGWRIYSSGPGIYMNQLISNCLGIRQENGGLVIDPVLPTHLDGLSFNFKVNGCPVTFTYHLQAEEKRVTVNGEAVEATLTTNRYRQGGLFIDGEKLATLLNEDTNSVEIYL
ncbi:GH36-type glycosyl hydrolase domain-containing protein [Sutcliffiella sp. NC1]|uniref:GH36-type glycosyl hydrolase domain-containing protein n=1 Tax=Sutcliffiella sp. NC1 TaxID=3004096 RepID=UPI0022DD1BD7|nr:glycosyl hydrolase family 65 protein [Sutcliffiella sp. NC1]WBL14647.1 cellobiose phosphorylase [Sutcliffiella sp. NC1]